MSDEKAINVENEISKLKYDNFWLKVILFLQIVTVRVSRKLPIRVCFLDDTDRHYGLLRHAVVQAYGFPSCAIFTR